MLKFPSKCSRGKAISSYLLSGINIRKMINDELQPHHPSPNQYSILKMSKRPVFKIKANPNEKENPSNCTSALPSKSFKIRSFTKKLRENGSIRLDDSSGGAEIFEKLENVRNFKSISNRLEIYSQVKDSREDIEESASKTSTKMKEVLRREASLKCKIGSQIFIKEPITPQHQIDHSPNIQFQRFDSEPFRQLANKIHVHFNQSSQNEAKQQQLLIVSMDALFNHSRRYPKSAVSQDFVQGKHNCFSQEQAELVKLLSNHYYPHDYSLKSTRVCFKVQSAAELLELKNLLENSHIDDYYCIFYPIKKYAETWNLYTVDSLLGNSRRLILLQAKSRVKHQFPIISTNLEILFITTQFDGFLNLSRVISAIKNIPHEQFQSDSILHPLIEDFQEEATTSRLRQNQKIENSLINNAKYQEVVPRKDIKYQKTAYRLPQYDIRHETLRIDASELKSKLNFAHQSKIIKGNQRGRRNMSNEGRSKRRVLCQRENNVHITVFAKNSSMISFEESCEEKWNLGANRNDSLEELKDALLQCLKEKRKQENKAIINEKQPSKKNESTDKNDDLEEITNYIKGNTSKCKTNHQIVSDLLKKNHHINKQINQYIQHVSSLVILSDHIINIERQSQELNITTPYQSKQSQLQVAAYRIL